MTEPELSLDVVICRPVEWVGKIYDTVPETPVYPGSIKSKCTLCGVDIWIGPRQQEHIAEPYRLVVVACFLCAAASGAKAENVTSLGNPYTKEEP